MWIQWIINRWVFWIVFDFLVVTVRVRARMGQKWRLLWKYSSGNGGLLLWMSRNDGVIIDALMIDILFGDVDEFEWLFD
jgi:hypothetical protein